MPFYDGGGTVFSEFQRFSFLHQLLAGFAIFGWPGGTDSFKKMYLDSHRFFGIGIFLLGEFRGFSVILSLRVT